MMNYCCKVCCPCLVKSKEKRSSKYSYVKYTPPSGKLPPQLDKTVSKSLVSEPEKVFEFPQGKCELVPHPEMFRDVSSVISDQPRRFSSQVSTSSVGSDYSEYVATGKVAATNESHHDLASLLPKEHQLSTIHTMSGSLPDLTESPKVLPLRKTSTLPRRKRSDFDDYSGWIPGLPVLEETALQSEDVSYPMLQFSLHYDVQRCVLTLHLHHGSNLPAKDRRGTSDPFVVVYMMPNKEEIFESKVVRHSLDPVFDQSFEFQRLMPNDIRKQTLVLRVYDHDKFSKNDTIGGIILPLENADLFGVVMRMRIDEDPEIFKENSQGDLLLALTYDPLLSLLKGVVLKATNLKKQDVVGLADPYVKVRLYSEDKMISKWKSSIKHRTLLPIYNEGFQFDIAGKDINRIKLEVLVMDYDRFSKNDVMGKVVLRGDANTESASRQWRDMIYNPHHSISQWHSLRSVK